MAGAGWERGGAQRKSRAGPVECGGPQCGGAAATQRRRSVARGGNGTRGAASSAFSRGRIAPGCYWHCPDFGKTLQGQTEHIWGAAWHPRDPSLAAAPTPGPPVALREQAGTQSAATHAPADDLGAPRPSWPKELWVLPGPPAPCMHHDERSEPLFPPHLGEVRRGGPHL